MLYSSQEPATPTLCITSPGAASCSLLHFKSSAHLTATPKTLPNKVFSQGCWIFQVSESESDSAHHNSCVWVFSPTPSDSSTPAGCPTTQFNSDTIYLEIASDSTGKGSVSLSLSHTHTHSRCQLQVGLSLALLTNWPQSEVPMTLSLDLINFLEQLTDLRKLVYSLDYQFITKDIKGYISTAR